MSKDMQIQSIWFDLILGYKNLQLLERKFFLSQKLVRNGQFEQNLVAPKNLRIFKNPQF